MAGIHELGESVKLVINTHVGVTLTDPSDAAFPKVQINDPKGTQVVAATLMTNTSTGVWFYWWATSALTLRGIYTVIYTTEHLANGTDRISQKTETIRLR